MTTTRQKSNLVFSLLYSLGFAGLNYLLATHHEAWSNELSLFHPIIPVLLVSLAVFLLMRFGPMKLPIKILISLSVGFFYYNGAIQSWLCFAPLVFVLAAMLYPTKFRPAIIPAISLYLVVCLVLTEDLSALSFYSPLEASQYLNNSLFSMVIPLFEISLIPALIYLYARHFRLFIYVLYFLGLHLAIICLVMPDNTWPSSVASIACLVLTFAYWANFSDTSKPKSLKLLNKLELVKLIRTRTSKHLALSLIVPVFLTIPSALYWGFYDLFSEESFSYATLIDDYVSTLPAETQNKIVLEPTNTCADEPPSDRENLHFLVTIYGGYAEYGSYDLYEETSAD